jgi:hypothetical protein
VIDAAQDKAAPKWAAECGLETQCLYSGAFGASLAEVAPHLTTFDPQGDFANWLFARWDRNYGILLQTTASFDELRKHLKKFLVVKDPAGRRLRFRFYDPRILRVFLPMCTRAELKEFFGPVACYYAPGRLGESVWAFEWSRKGMSAREYPVLRPPLYLPAEQGVEAETSTAQRRPPTGTLTVVAVDAETGWPIRDASVQASGPATREAVTGPWGETRFVQLPVGDYKVFAIDAKYRMGTQTTTVTEEGARVEVACASTAAAAEQT